MCIVMCACCIICCNLHDCNTVLQMTFLYQLGFNSFPVDMYFYKVSLLWTPSPTFYKGRPLVVNLSVESERLTLVRKRYVNDQHPFCKQDSGFFNKVVWIRVTFLYCKKGNLDKRSPEFFSQSDMLSSGINTDFDCIADPSDIIINRHSLRVRWVRMITD